jgi:hypothetical protein
MPELRRHGSLLLSLLALAVPSPSLLAQTGSENEPLRYVGGVSVHQHVHDGQLRPAVGVESFQVLRANRKNPSQSDGFGWTYNHAPMIAYWNGKFYLEYLSNPVGEHIAPGQTLLCTSADGRDWSTPKVVFPIYALRPPDPKGTAMMHQRMGFFVAPDGRLLVLGFYGHAPDPFGKGGIGRVVREVFKDGSFGPIYFLRTNKHSGWTAANTGYPSFKRSDDAGFITACQWLLDNRLMREQWSEEEFLDEDFFAFKPGGQLEAFNWYHRKDGKVVGLWKWSLSALSDDEGKTWSKPVKLPTITMAGAKISGRRTGDGRYALIYNPFEDNDHRWPLAIVTSDDGILFDHMLCVQGEVPPRRFAGHDKDLGSQYNRCLEEGNGQTPGKDLWVTYSMNKEDMWVSRIPVPVREKVTGPVRDTFDNLPTGGPVTDWNIHSPKWAPVRVVEFPSASDKSLQLLDKDPYDYARAVRVFPEGTTVRARFNVHAKQNDHGRLEIELQDRLGYRPVRLVFAPDGSLLARRGGQDQAIAKYQPDQWYDVEIKADAKRGSFSVALDDKPMLTDAPLAEYVKSIERISFRTGPYRDKPTRKIASDKLPDLTKPDPDVPVPLAVYHVDNVSVDSLTSTEQQK